MKSLFFTLLIALVGILSFSYAGNVEAKSRVKSYYRSGTKVRSYTRYKADGYKFNNYVYRPDRGYRR